MTRAKYLSDAASNGGFRLALAEAAEKVFEAYCRADSKHRAEFRRLLAVETKSYAQSVGGWSAQEDLRTLFRCLDTTD